MAYVAVGVVLESSSPKHPVGSLFGTILSKRPAKTKPWTSLLIDPETDALFHVTVRWVVFEKISMNVVKKQPKVFQSIAKALFEEAEEILKKERVMELEKKTEVEKQRSILEFIRVGGGELH